MGQDRDTGSTGVAEADAPDRAEAALAGLDQLQSWQEDLYRALHQHPELSDQEVQTAATAADTLRGAGYEVHDKIGTTGVVGILRNGDGPTVLVRADMDALPMKEETGLPYASTDQPDRQLGPGRAGRACLRTRRARCLPDGRGPLARRQHDRAWHGTFIPLFQPAEELGTWC